MDKKDWYYDQNIQEDEMDEIFDLVETGIGQTIEDVLNGEGVLMRDVYPTESGPSDYIVHVPANSSYVVESALIPQLVPVRWDVTQDIDCTNDKDSNPTVPSPGNKRYISVFAKFVRVESGAVIDGFGNPIFYNQDEGVEFEVWAGTEAASPSRVATPSESYSLLFEVLLNENVGSTGISEPSDWSVPGENEIDITLLPYTLLPKMKTSVLRLSSNVGGAESNSILFEESTIGDGMRIQYDGSAPGSGSMKIQSFNGDSTYLTVARSGLVGIGIEDPETGLDVLGHITSSDNIVDDNNKIGGLLMKHYDVDQTECGLITGETFITGNYVYIGGGSGSSHTAATLMVFYTSETVTDTSPTPRLTIIGDGKVGLGTILPKQTLDVIGYISTSSNETDDTNKLGGMLIKSYDVDEEEVLMIRGSSVLASSTILIGGGDGSFNASTEIGFYTASAVNTLTGTVRMTIKNDGLVGIGTNSPQTKLDVIGEITVSSNEADNTNKDALVLIKSYDVDEEEVLLVGASTVVGGSVVAVGGGFATHNAATEIVFYTAAVVNTLTGTLKMTIDPSGISLDGNGSSYPLKFGSDVQLYRSAANVLYTPDLLKVQADIEVGDSGVDGYITHGTDDDTYIRFSSSNDIIAFYCGATNPFSLSSNLAQVNSTAILNVVGDAKFGRVYSEDETTFTASGNLTTGSRVYNHTDSSVHTVYGMSAVGLQNEMIIIKNTGTGNLTIADKHASATIDIVTQDGSAATLGEHDAAILIFTGTFWAVLTVV